ncbi:hypothetical protein WJX81_007846 [Elliptochloris bilobata]|uniref:Uncharacterized protein n=1 Tax=Elliptochloris bilobata TaxID=381761 RepID=A0AAW1S1N6_9CHLO
MLAQLLAGAADKVAEGPSRGHGLGLTFGSGSVLTLPQRQSLSVRTAVGRSKDGAVGPDGAAADQQPAGVSANRAEQRATLPPAPVWDLEGPSQEAVTLRPASPSSLKRGGSGGVSVDMRAAKAARQHAEVLRGAHANGGDAAAGLPAVVAIRLPPVAPAHTEAVPVNTENLGMVYLPRIQLVKLMRLPWIVPEDGGQPAPLVARILPGCIVRLRAAPHIHKLLQGLPGQHRLTFQLRHVDFACCSAYEVWRFQELTRKPAQPCPTAEEELQPDVGRAVAVRSLQQDVLRRLCEPVPSTAFAALSYAAAAQPAQAVLERERDLGPPIFEKDLSAVDRASSRPWERSVDPTPNSTGIDTGFEFRAASRAASLSAISRAAASEPPPPRPPPHHLQSARPSASPVQRAGPQSPMNEPLPFAKRLCEAARIALNKMSESNMERIGSHKFDQQAVGFLARQSSINQVLQLDKVAHCDTRIANLSAYMTRIVYKGT